jgi:hypothetical protein
LVANCESGLLSGAWSTTSVELEEVEGPWHLDDDECAPNEVAVVDDVIALASADRVIFARSCD